MARIRFDSGVVFAAWAVFGAISVSANEPDSPKGEKQLGTLTGRFVLPGKPPEPNMIPINPIRRTIDGKEFLVDELAEYAKLKLVDESLIVNPTGGVKNVVIWLSDKNLPPYEPLPLRRLHLPATLTFQGGKLSPHLLVFESWRPLEVVSESRWATNLRWSGVQSSAFNRILPPSLPTKSSQFSENLRAEKLPFPIRSDIHPWLSGWLFPVAHPYFAVSGDDGSFQIERLPPGEWEFTVWHECWGYTRTDDWPRGRFTQKIKVGENLLGEIKLPAETMHKK